MSTRAQVVLWVAQRACAAVLALCVLVHLVTIVYAVHGGLTAAEILGAHARQRRLGRVLRAVRARGRVHAPIGLRNVLQRMAALARTLARCCAAALRRLLAWAGMRAVVGVFA